MDEEKKDVEDKDAGKKPQVKESKEKTASPGKKKFSLKMILIIAGAILVVGGGAIGAITYFKQSNATVEESGENSTNKDQPADLMTENFPLNTFIVNLADSDRNKYLKITMELEIEGIKAKEEIEKNQSKIKDLIVVFLSAKNFEEVRSIEGKIELKTELIKRINASLKSGSVRDIFFTEFVVQ